jgi:hypothetical protein
MCNNKIVRYDSKKKFYQKKIKICRKVKQNKCKNNEKSPTPFSTKPNPGFRFYRSWLLRPAQNEIYIYVWRKHPTPVEQKRDLYFTLGETTYSFQGKTGFSEAGNCYSKLELSPSTNWEA